MAAGSLCSSSVGWKSWVAGRVGYSVGCLGSAWISAVWWITILSPSGDCVRGHNGFPILSAGCRAVREVLARKASSVNVVF